MTAVVAIFMGMVTNLLWKVSDGDSITFMVSTGSPHEFHSPPCCFAARFYNQNLNSPFDDLVAL